MWIARDKNGNLFLYNTELTRNENGVWFPADYQPSNPFYCVKLPSDLFPEQTWEDAPLEVEIKRLSGIFNNLFTNEEIEKDTLF